MRLTTEQVKDWMDKLGPAPKGKAAKYDAGDEIVGTGCEKDGQYWLRREYYVPESFSDDDLSFTGFALPPKMGLTRRYVQIHDESFDRLKTRVSELRK